MVFGVSLLPFSFIYVGTLSSFPQEKGEADKNDVDFPFSVSFYRTVIFICLLLSPQTSKSWRGRIRSPSRYLRHLFRRSSGWQRTTSNHLRSTRSCRRIKIKKNGSRGNLLIMSSRRTKTSQKMIACKAWKANKLTPFILKACMDFRSELAITMAIKALFNALNCTTNYNKV